MLGEGPNAINMTVFECASNRPVNGKFRPFTDAEVPVSKKNVDEISKRQFPCTLPANECVVNTVCKKQDMSILSSIFSLLYAGTGVECFAPRGPVTAADCSNLGAQLVDSSESFAEQSISFIYLITFEAGTFTVLAGQGNGFNLGTCVAALFNNEPSLVLQESLSSLVCHHAESLRHLLY